MAEEPGTGGETPNVSALQAELASARLRIRELNDESKSHRLNGERFRQDADSQKAALEAALAEHTAKLTAAETAAAEKIAAAQRAATEAAEKAKSRVVNADLRLAAKDAGANDVADVLALLDRSQMQLDDDGGVKNAGEMMAALKKSKPYLFGGQATTSSTATPPSQTPAAGKHARDMSDAEFAALGKSLGLRF